MTDTWIQFGILLMAALTGVVGFGLGLVKLGMMISGMRREVTPNGGSTNSLGDKVARLERWRMEDRRELMSQSASLARIETKLKSPRPEMGEK